MLLAGCLSYSNSAMNPILYAFLSDNFKKSFMKACACATGREANRVLEVENSVMPRRRTLLGGHHAHNASTKARAMAKVCGSVYVPCLAMRNSMKMAKALKIFCSFRPRVRGCISRRTTPTITITERAATAGPAATASKWVAAVSARTEPSATSRRSN